MMKWFKRKKQTDAVEGEVEEQPASADDVSDASGAAMAPEESAAEPDEAAPDARFERFPDEEGEAVGTNEAMSVEPQGPAEKRRFFSRLRERLHRTRERLSGRLDRVFHGRKTIDADLLDELEEALITSDLGVRTTHSLLKTVAEKIARKELSDPQKLRDLLREEIKAILDVGALPWPLANHRPFVIMVIGVNGVGKTTTIGKLAHALKQEDRSVMLVAGDTFRAAAVEQLSLWGDRIGVPVIRQKSGSDPSAVAFDALEAATARQIDVVILDTAGRMHTKVNLMEELKKIQRVVSRKLESAPHEVLLVLDATTGQNALSQARQFQEGIGLTGLVLTKLDGTAKGGIVVAICDELKVPVRYIGIGEGMDDLRPFDPDEFVRAMF